MKPSYIWYALAIFMGVLLDQWTKLLIVNNIHTVKDFLDVLPFLSIVRTHNLGVSFGMLSGLNLGAWFYGVLVLAITVFLTVMLAKTQTTLSRIAYASIISGALGNLIDRFLRGYVVDFVSVHWFHKYHFYVFNVADIFITCGSALIILDVLLEKRKN